MRPPPAGGRYERIDAMEKLRILPVAAIVIALTAVVGVGEGKARSLEDGFARNRVTLVRDLGKAERTVAQNPAYLVQIRRGGTSAEVLVDAVTGKILSS